MVLHIKMMHSFTKMETKDFQFQYTQVWPPNCLLGFCSMWCLSVEILKLSWISGLHPQCVRVIAANLIGDKMDTESLCAYSRQLIQLVIKEILPGTPISLRCLDEYIVSATNVFDRVLLSNDIPVTDIPPCLLTELMCRKVDAIKNYWITFTREQLRSIFMTFFFLT